MLNKQRVLRTLQNSWSQQTSTKWTQRNPASGQCSVTALVVQDRFGGGLLKTRIGDAWHFYNEIDGDIHDFTSQQFERPPTYGHLPATRDEALIDTSPEQYQHLGDAFAQNWSGCEGGDSKVVTAVSRIALVGDYNAAVKAHQAIPQALTLASEPEGHLCEWEWLHTSAILDDPSKQLADFHGVWCVPASPYASTQGALAAIRLARQTGLAFLGTCGGFQHALLEYAEAVWGVAKPAHAELDPDAVDPVIAPLSCSLVEQSGEIHFEPGSRLAAIYGIPAAVEGYHCRYGLSSHYSDRLTAGPLHASGHDRAGEIRAVELRGHPFFVATLFQPERSALAGRRHPLVSAFVDAVRERAAV
jgi:CTP synthase (UTP-ammonia lyase)